MPLFRSHGKVEKTGRKRKLAFPTELCGPLGSPSQVAAPQCDKPVDLDT